MNFKLYFCNDGVLRVKYGEKSELIDLKFIQDQSEYKNNDFKFFKKWLNTEVFFEDKLDVYRFVLALNPWIDFMSEFLDIDLKSYISEAKKLSVVSKTEEGANEKFDYITLCKYTEIDPEIEFEKSTTDDLKNWFNEKEKKYNLTGKYNFSTGVRVNGYKNEEIEQYGIDWVPFNILCGVPIYLNNNHYIYVNDFFIEKKTGEKNNILKKDGHGVNEISGEQRGEFQYLNANTCFSLREVLEGFFDDFMYNPVIRDNLTNKIKALADEANKNENVNKKEINHKQNGTEESGVVELETKELNGNDKEKKLNVVFAPGAFDDVIDDLKRESDYFKDIVKLAKKEGRLNRIGSIEIGEPPEKRFFGFIVDNNKKSKKLIK